MSRARRIALLVSLVACVVPGTSRATTLFDPALRFRVLPTEHFVIYFHRGEEGMAQRLAAIAEETWRTLQQPLGVTPPRRTHVVLADQTELPNAYATPLPYNTIVVYSVWPSGSDFDFDDWLRLVFTHEFTHIVHLDRSERWARRVRSIFGRTPIAFPNLFLPTWQIEGLATYEESAITGTGRLHAGDFRAIVDEAARARALEPLDRVNGGLTDWPGGAAAYAYGAGFHQYLADTYGAEKLAALATGTAGWLPYTGARVFRRVYGKPLGTLWRDYTASAEAHARATATPPAADPPTRLTQTGFSVRGPRFDRFVCPDCPPAILYSASDPHGFPALYRIGAGGGAPRQMTTRYLGSTTAMGRDEVYFDQLEVRRNVGIYSDLYALSRANGRVRRLTRDARLLDPDLSPDGTTLVCVQDQPGQRNLVTVRLPAVRLTPDTSGDGRALDVTTLIAGPETQFDAPKWSPDGRSIAVERHRLGAMPEIVVVDVATNTVRVLASDRTTRYVMPAWRPDGGAIVAAAAAGDQTFNLVEISADGAAMRQLTQTTGGATSPDVSPDGTTIVFVGYTPDGFDLFTMPYPDGDPERVARHPDGDPERVARHPDSDPERVALHPDSDPERVALPAESGGPRPPHTSAVGPPFQGGRTDGVALPADQTDDATLPYSPLKTLKPTSWFPVIERDSDQIRVGATTGGVDVLGYHAYAASATWLVSGPEGAVTPRGSSPDWQAYYAYGRWQPTFYATSSSLTSFFAGPPTDAGTPTAATRRERRVEAGVLLPIRRARLRHSALLSMARSVDEFTMPTGTLSRRRTPLHAAWQTITGRRYGYSVSREDGVAAGATAEIVRRGLGSFADATILTGDLRVYLPGFGSHHVAAIRVAGGASSGDPTVGRTFRLGGGDAAEDVVDFGSGAFSLLRGFRPNTFAGTRVALVNAEYRFPIARPQRGIGTWPLFLHSLHGALFADAGHAWTRAFRSSAIKTSAGAQISADIVAGYFAPFTMTVGAASGRDGSGLVAGRVTAYVRVGRAF